MAITNIQTGPGFTEDGKFVSSVEAGILFSNVGAYPVKFTFTDDGSLPSIEPELCHVILPGDRQAVTLKAGEGVHFSGKNCNVSVEV